MSVRIMGVLNCTPDSFSDGGQYLDSQLALEQAHNMLAAGADIIDVGGESTRPGAEIVPLAEELHRTIPIVRALAAADVCVSIDTSKAEVMRQAVDAGAKIINDVTALRGDKQSLRVAAQSGADVEVCLMHMQGKPRCMQSKPQYTDVVSEIEDFFLQRIAVCKASGINPQRLLLDPGIGFGKTLAHNLTLIRAIPRFKKLGLPLLMGVSRKSFLGSITGATTKNREIETAAAVAICCSLGADIIRVHDVKTQTKAATIGSALYPLYLK
ncbi:MAG: dihydropteroate synthase [Mariprofundales bacterium]